MKQQIILSGTGGQGILFITRVLAEAAILEGLEVITSETHGMAMRGGTVISHIKVGTFRSPLIRSGRADIGLFLKEENVAIHGSYLGRSGLKFVNTNIPGDYYYLDATAIARDMGAVVVLNLVLLGYAVGKGRLFCGPEVIGRAIEKISNPKQLDLNRKGFEEGLTRAVS
jgi:indolepyruvate ferredoxin oxidoreductase, beta subunit